MQKYLYCKIVELEIFAFAKLCGAGLVAVLLVEKLRLSESIVLQNAPDTKILVLRSCGVEIFAVAKLCGAQLGYRCPNCTNVATKSIGNK